jgi:hypothetical protein
LKEIKSESTRNLARLFGDNSSWTRNRNMPIEDMIKCILNKKGLTTVMELRSYFRESKNMEQTISKQGYLKQRKKLNFEVFKVLNQNYLRRFYSSDETVLWNNYVVFAIDGSKMEIPNSDENRQVYGVSENQYGESVSRANFSALYDVYNHFLLDIDISNCNSGELESAKKHIISLKEILGEREILIIFDRNYPSLEFIDFLERYGVKYLIRLSSIDYKYEVSNMVSGDEETELRHTNSRLSHIREKFPDRALELSKRSSTSVRLIKTVFDKGDICVLMTNIRECSMNDISELYRYRWKIETKYHTLKNKLKFESITGKDSIYVLQDCWAQTLVFNIIQDLITKAEYELSEKCRDKSYKYEMRINENIAIGLFKEKFIYLMLEEDIDKKEKMFNELINDIEKNIVPIRKLKSSPRKWNPSNKYKCNQKPSF